VREVVAGSNFKAQNELTLHFGLGSAAMVDRITVTWPGGATRTVRNYSADERWTLYPTERLGDANGDGVLDRRDVRRFVSCFFADGLQPGCEVMDLDGDGDVDVDDYLLFVAMNPNSPQMHPR